MLAPWKELSGEYVRSFYTTNFYQRQLLSRLKFSFKEVKHLSQGEGVNIMLLDKNYS